MASGMPCTSLHRHLVARSVLYENSETIQVQAACSKIRPASFNASRFLRDLTSCWLSDGANLSHSLVHQSNAG